MNANIMKVQTFHSISMISDVFKGHISHLKISESYLYIYTYLFVNT